MNYERLQKAVTDSLTTLLENASAYFPNFLGAVVLLVFGWLFARLVRASVDRVVGGIVARVGRMTTSGDGLPRPAAHNAVVSAVAAGVYWLILLVFLLAAIRLLALPVLDSVVVAVGAYLPHLIAAGIIVACGYLAGSAARGAIAHSARSAGVAYGDLLGRILQSVVVVVAIIVAIDELGVDNSLLVIAAGIFMGATLGGAAVAFGLGARTAASNLLASYYVQRSYRPGHVVRIGEVEGRILEIGDTVVVVETEEGRMHVPARLFSEQASLLVTDVK